MAQLIAHQPVQSFKALAHVHCLDRDINLRRQSQTEHAVQPSATRIARAKSASANFHGLSIRRPFTSTSEKPSELCDGAGSMATSTSFGFRFFCARRQ